MTTVNGMDVDSLDSYVDRIRQDRSVADRNFVAVAHWEGETRSRVEVDGRKSLSLGGNDEFSGMHTVLGALAARFTFQPGWKWSECIKPSVGTDSCQARHVGAIVSGTLHVVHQDGSEGDAAPGDAYVIEPGHDAWVLGDNPVVALEFESKSAAEYAKG